MPACPGARKTGMARLVDASPRCPACGAANVAHATFCLECGEPLDGTPLARGTGGAEWAAPPRRGALVRQLARRGELWLGAALILGVLGFALFDWQHQEEQAALYHTGDTAAALRHWTAAHTAFARLGDYRDAAIRATEAATQIGRRDASYQAAGEALHNNDFITAYSALSQTVAIEPDYIDAPALLAQARRAVIGGALTDTVYRRVSGGKPGLYLHQANGSEWGLPGSDAQSRIWTATADGRIVYDGPTGPAMLTSPAPTPTGDDWDRRLQGGRQLWLVTSGSAAPPQPLSRTFGLGGGLVVGQDGVWWFDPIASGQDDTHGYDVRGQPLRLLAYYTLPALHANDAALADNTYFLLDMDPAGGRLLIGHYTWDDRKQTVLYVAGPTGGTIQTLALVAGIVNTAHFSPNGQYVLYSAEMPAAVPGQLRQELVAIDDTNPAHPAQVLARMTPDSIGLSDRSLRGTFVPGPGPPRVLIRRQDGATSRLSIRNLHNDVETTLLEDMGALPNVWLPADGQNLLLWQQPPGSDPHLVIQPLNPRQPAITLAPFTPTISTISTFVEVALTGDSVFYTVQQLDTTLPDQIAMLWGESVSVYGATVKTRATPAVPLCQRPLQPDGDTLLQPLAAGLAACVSSDNRLRLLTPDGETAIPALDGVDALWPLRQTMWFWQP